MALAGRGLNRSVHWSGEKPMLSITCAAPLSHQPGIMMKIDGSCHCGFLKYEARIDPEAIYICHCTDCQSISGGAFRWAVTIPAEDFSLLSGEPRTYVKRADSGAVSHQLFCPECASPLYSRSLTDGPKLINLRLGTARQRDRLIPRRQLWCGSAQGWITVTEPTETLDRQ